MEFILESKKYKLVEFSEIPVGSFFAHVNFVNSGSVTKPFLKVSKDFAFYTGAAGYSDVALVNKFLSDRCYVIFKINHPLFLEPVYES